MQGVSIITAKNIQALAFNNTILTFLLTALWTKWSAVESEIYKANSSDSVLHCLYIRDRALLIRQ